MLETCTQVILETFICFRVKCTLDLKMILFALNFCIHGTPTAEMGGGQI